MTAAQTIDEARGAFGRKAWAEAYAGLSSAQRAAALGPEDLELLGTAAHLTGRQIEATDTWARAHHEFVRAGAVERAARVAFWLSLDLLIQGEPAQSGGWLARGRRLLADGRDCVEQGYMLMIGALQTFWEGDAAGSKPRFEQAAAIAERFGDADLIGLTRLSIGETLVRLGHVGEGLSLLDEVMAAVTAGELSNMATGIVYCATIGCCYEVFDLRRAQEWTSAFARWCDSQPDLVPYRGQCLVHRSQLMQLQGSWPAALREAQRACESLSHPGSRAWAADGYYQQGEVRRLRGEFAEAEEAYRQANHWGRVPQPGLAQLRLAQGRIDAAVAAIRGAVDEAHDHVARSRVLPAHVEIMLAAGDLAGARAAATELAAIVSAHEAPLLKAVSDQALGAVLLAEGDAPSALAVLRRAWTAWQRVDAPYEAAQARVLIARACRTLGDEDGAMLELDEARQTFQRLGAAPDLARLQSLAGGPGPIAGNGLTGREIEVLRLIAAGKTNRAIATDLVLSEKTVARHVSNIFTKLGLSSRSAATAYAYEHGLQ